MHLAGSSKANIANQSFSMEPMSKIFADFNFAERFQNCETKFHKNVYPQEFLPVKDSINKVIIKSGKIMAVSLGN